MEMEDPLELFEVWFAKARLKELNDPNAMYVASVDEDGLPNIRVVLMKDYDHNGFVFYTNTQSAKGTELLTSPRAAFCFNWKSLNKSVVVRGNVGLVADGEADAYFQSRARQSRLGAWASKQSRPLKSKAHLLKEVAGYALKFGVGQIPRPDHWTGFRLNPLQIDFRDETTAPAKLIRYDKTHTGLWQIEPVVDLHTQAT